MSIKHFSHKHPLVLIQEQSHTSEKAHCSGSNEPVDHEQCHARCKDQVEGPSYCCTDCKFYLHKTCAEQPQEINHPFHRKHPLTLLAHSPYPSVCNFCRNPCKGFVYHCSSCKFYLHVNCFLLQQFFVGKFSEFQHFGHKHPLIFIEKHNNEVRNPCSACKEPLLGSIYGCFDCGFYLHEACVKLPREINDPFHRKHPLKLLAKSSYRSGIYICDFCNRHCGGFVYHCSSCQFDLHVKCALHPIFSGGNIPEIKHFSHEHPLIFIEKHKIEVQDSCSWCEESLSGPIYSCFDCGFHLDKKCFELPLEINHPFHRRHPLVILDKPPNPAKDTCNFCRSRFWGFLYHCSTCGFNLHIRCALIAQLNPENVEEIRHFSHEAHPLIFIEKHSIEVNDSCIGCRKRLSGPIYSCLDCMFHLHKKCVELPVEINHPSHRKHPLVLLANPPTHQKGCSCYLCKKQMQSKGFVYYCSDCKFGSMPEDVSLPRMTTPENHDHEHPFTLVSRPISFICDFCGIDGYGTPYLCPTCDLVVENDCISFPSTIRIIRHPHKISHIYFLPEKNKIEMRECSICRKNVNTEHGSYYCGDCNYIVHVHCATDEFIWDRTTDLDDEDQMSKGALRSSIIIEQIRDGEDLIASKIKHIFHQHDLTLTRALDDGLNQDDKSCDGCMQPISAPFYSCGKCDFFLDGNCAELHMEKRHPLHRHPLTLYKRKYISNCKACLRFHHGLSYRCNKCDFDIDIQCSLLSDTFKQESHEHQLFLDHKYEGNCSACPTHIAFRRGAFRCKYCEFVLDFKCITLPHKAWYKYDRHFLNLTYTDNSDPNQHYCDICEEERNPKHWFYYCKDCDNSVHPECVLGELQHIKLGRTYRVSVHPHPLVFVKKIWNLPLCKVCGSLCKVQFLECRSGCDFTIHWRCKDSFNDESEMQLPNYESEMQSLFGDGRMEKS
ncbi:hypothetical protein CRYUN_Cryun08bG0101200 [Craigia yunnanensis]